MKAIFVFLILALAARAQVSESFGGNIVLGRPTDRSVTVNAVFPADHDSVYVEYGLQSGAAAAQTAPQAGIKANVPFVQVLSGLEPDRRYFYRIRYRRSPNDAYAASAEHRFQTKRAAGTAFTFTVVADSHLFTAAHNLPERYALTLANARADGPDFHFDLGDTFRTDTIANRNAPLTEAQVVARSLAHRPYFGIVTADAPLFLVLGNHDSEYLYYTRAESNQNPQLPVWSANARLANYSNPAPDGFYSGDTATYAGIERGGQRHSYYAFEWGDALFVALDPYWNMPAQNAQNWVPVHGDAQYEWLKTTLRASKAKYKFVFAHHLLGQGRGGVEVAGQYEWGGVDPRRTRTFAEARPGWEKPIHALFVETGVTAFVQGHDHLYARGELDGIAYISVPMPAAGPPGAADYFPGNETAGNFDAYLRSATLPSSGHLRVRVAPEGVRFDYVAVRLAGRDTGANGHVADTFFKGSSAGPALAVVSAASYSQAAVAPDSLATAFGANLPTSAVTVAVTDSAGRTRTVTPVAGTANQLSFVVPAETAAGPAKVEVLRAGTVVAAGTVPVATVAPGLFSANATGFGVAAATALTVRANGEQAPQAVFRCPAGGCVAAPLDPGAVGEQLVLTFYGTGFRGRRAVSDVVVYVAGVRGEVLYAGPHPVYPGLDQLNVRVPTTLAVSGESGVVVSVEGRSANVTTVSLQ